jgi:hypothetical protein
MNSSGEEGRDTISDGPPEHPIVAHSAAVVEIQRIILPPGWSLVVEPREADGRHMTRGHEGHAGSAAASAVCWGRR